MRGRISLVLFILLASRAFSLDSGIVINNGHLGKVNDMVMQEKYNLLFSAGDDGSFRLWNPDSRTLTASIQAAPVPIKKIALNPAGPEIAVVEQHGASSFRLSVWNWRDKKKIFSIRLEELPYHLSFSPLGTYVLYTGSNYKSLYVLDASTGRVLPYINEGFGIVTALIMSPTEKTLMTYQPSGSIQYWDLRENTRKQSIPCVPNLTQISFTQNLRYMFGYKENYLYLVDLVSGKTVTYQYTNPIISSSFNPLNGEAGFLIDRQGQSQELLFIDTNSSSLNSRTIPLSGRAFQRILYRFNSVYLCAEDGVISILDTRYQIFSQFPDNRLAAISDIAVNDNHLLVAAGKTIHVFGSSFFSSQNTDAEPSDLSDRQFNNPFDGPVGLERLEMDNFIIWSKSEPGSYVFFNADYGVVAKPYLSFDSPFQGLESDENSILVLESGGKIHMIDRQRNEIIYSYESYGLTSAVLDGTKIIAGKSRQTGFQSSLIIIDTVSGETVPVFDSNLISYSLLMAPDRKTLYSIGFENVQGAVKTVLKSHTGASFGREQRLLQFEGEDFSADFRVDSDSSTVYTTLGQEAITAVGRNGVRVFEERDHVPRGLRLNGRFLYVLNKDYTVSVWDTAEGGKIAELYIFRDDNWIVSFPGGDYASSPYAGSYISPQE